MELITHSGPFQADDVLAYAFLSICFPNHKLIRSRDPQIVCQPDPTRRVIFDVGGFYEPKNYQFDHHYDSTENLPRYNERSFAPMSASGLVYKHFCASLIREIMGNTIVDKASNRELESFYDLVYARFIHDFDAVDNGVYNAGKLGLVSSSFLDHHQIALSGDKYCMYTHLSALVNLMNVPQCTDEEIIKNQFIQVADVLKKIFCMVVRGLWYRHVKKQTIVKSPLSNKFAVYIDTTTPKCSPHHGSFHIYRDSEKNYCLYTSEHGLELPDTVPSNEFVFLHKNRFVCKYKNIKDFATYLSRVIHQHANITDVGSLTNFIIENIHNEPKTV